jgi:predicted DNA-binding transcriptional regulator AlpA
MQILKKAGCKIIILITLLLLEQVDYYLNIPKLIRMKQVAQIVGVYPSRINQLSRYGRFPKPVYVAPGCKVRSWVESEVIEFVIARKDAGK